MLRRPVPQVAQFLLVRQLERMGDFYTNNPVPTYRVVLYGLLAAAGVAVVAYFQHDHRLRLYFGAIFCGACIAGVGFLLNRAVANVKPISVGQNTSQNTKPRFNYAAIIVGVSSACLGLHAICTGHIAVGRRHPHTFFAAQDPHGFWFMVGVIFLAAAICFFFGFTGRK